MTDLKREVGRFDYPQEFCPECFEADDISDVPDGNGDLFVTCACGFQWHEPDVEDCQYDDFCGCGCNAKT